MRKMGYNYRHVAAVDHGEKVPVEQYAQRRKSLYRFLPRRLDTRKKIVDLSENLVPIIATTKFATVIHNIFTPEECAAFIAMTEDQGYVEALIHGSTGSEVLRKDIRDCGRCIVRNEELSNAWFQRTMQALEGNPLKEKLVHARYVGFKTGTVDKHLQVCGLNEQLRALRYTPGQHYSLHQDNSFTRGPEFGEREGETSHLTFLLYLNADFKGGETRLQGGSRWLDVVPKVGSVLICDHDIYHMAMPVVSGKKYCCRSDFMYTHV